MGKVYLVGAGPGDPDLITVKALKCIQKADVILYDRLVNKCLLDNAKSNATLVYCGKLPNHHLIEQETINHLLVKYAKQGKVVTRLKGGDPFVYGRGAEEAEALAKNGVSFEIVPGITAGIAAPAYAGIPVTHREVSSSFAVITGHRSKGKPNDENWGNLVNGVDTLVIYMGVKNLPFICDSLLKYGKDPDTPVALIYWGTTSEQRTVTGTLRTIVGIVSAKKVENPSMIIIGEVVELRKQIAWFQDCELQEDRFSVVGETV